MTVLPPGGRLTLVSGQPMPANDVASATEVFYTPDRHSGVWINGSFYQLSGDLACPLDPAVLTGGNLWDLYLAVSGGVPFLGVNTTPWWASPAWQFGGDRVNAAAKIARDPYGLWTSAMSIALDNGGAITSGIAPNTALYVGTIVGTGNGVTCMVMRPPSAPYGGSGNVLGLYNAYNRREIKAHCWDAVPTWTNNYGGWIAVDVANGGNNFIRYVDGLGETQAHFEYIQAMQGDGFVGININGGTTMAPNGPLIGIGNVQPPPNNIQMRHASVVAQLVGYTMVMAVEAADGPWDGNPVQQTTTGLGAGTSILRALIEM